MTLDIHRILQKLPHRYPFLLVDRVLSIEDGARITAIKNVTIHEPFVGGHFPHRPVMPGVLMLEALAQTSALLVYSSLEDGLASHRRRLDRGRRRGDPQQPHHIEATSPRAPA